MNRLVEFQSVYFVLNRVKFKLKIARLLKK